MGQTNYGRASKYDKQILMKEILRLPLREAFWHAYLVKVGGFYFGILQY